MAKCEIIFNSHSASEPHDSDGCFLLENHEGNHRFLSDENKIIEWNYDFNCGCDDCCTDDISDMCIIFFEVLKFIE